MKRAYGAWIIRIKRVKDNNIRLAVLCSPHNPCGRVWKKEEPEFVMNVFEENDVIVVSDEIWSDIVFTGYKHISTYSVSEDAKRRTISIYALVRYST